MHAMTKSQPPSTPNKHAALVAQACRRIEAAEQPPSLDDLALQAGLSPFHFHRVFKAATGLTPKAYATAQRAQAVRTTLARGTSSVTAAIFDAGFNANSRFYEHADAMLGMKPTQYRAGGVDARFLGFVNQSGLPSVYASSDVVVLPSTAVETWGLVINEAMACGVPAVVSDAVGCEPDLIEPGITGAVAPLGDVAGLATAVASVLALDVGTTRRALAERMELYSPARAAAGLLEAADALASRNRVR